MTIQTVTSNNLDAFNAARMGVIAEPKPEPKEAKPEPKEAKPEPVAEEPKAAVVDEPKDDADDPKPDADAEPAEKPKKPANKLQNRFDEITAAKRAAEERAAAAEARAAELEAKFKPREEPKQANAKPDPKDFTDAFEYADKLAAWSANEALAARDRQEAERKESDRRQGIVDKWVSRVEVLKQTRPDYDEMLSSSEARVHDAARDEMMESPFGPDIALALAEDDTLAKMVSEMNPRQQLKWIGKMESAFESKSTKAEALEEPEARQEPVIRERPKAPAPITPVKGTRSAADPINEPGEFKGSYSEYKAARLRGLK